MSTGLWAKDDVRSSQKGKTGGLVGHGVKGAGLGHMYSVNSVNSERKCLFQLKYFP